MIRIMEKFPAIVWLGAALVGWVGGETISSDSALSAFAATHGWLRIAAPAAGASLVVGIALWHRRQASNSNGERP
jgi:predicted tellurium resistance membrane protein TerC